MRQLIFDFLEEKEKYSFDDFIILNENREAYSILIEDDYNDYIQKNVILLSGPEKSGKTYLANLWKIKKNAKVLNYNSFLKLSEEQFTNQLSSIIESYDYYIIDNFECKNINEQKLFHLLNIIYEMHSKLLIVCNKDIANYKFKINDLKSRINAGIKIKIKELSEDDKNIMILRFLSNKKINLSRQAIRYIEKISPDTFKKIYDFINKLDLKAKEEKKKITIPFIKKYISTL